jgi:hypothetical protein
MARKEHRKPSYPAALRMMRIAFELPLHPFGWPLEAIRRELGISERTLKRYLAAGRELVDRSGQPCFEVVTHGAGPLLRLPAARRPVEPSAYRAVSLYFTRALMKFLKGTLLEEGIAELWAGFTRNLPPAQRGDLATLDRKFYAIAYIPKDYRRLGNLLHPIIHGLIREYRLRIKYATGLAHEVDLIR